MNDDFDDCRSQPAYLGYSRNQLVIEVLCEPLPRKIALILFVWIQRRQLILEQRHHARITIARRSHGFHDVARVQRMVVAVVRDEAPTVVVGGEEPDSVIGNRHK